MKYWLVYRDYIESEGGHDCDIGQTWLVMAEDSERAIYKWILYRGYVSVEAVKKARDEFYKNYDVEEMIPIQ